MALNIAAELAAAAVTDSLVRTENPIGAPWVKMNPGTTAGKCQTTVGSEGYTPATSFAGGEDDAYYSTKAYASSATSYVFGRFTVSRIGSNERQTGVWLLRDEAKPVETQSGYCLRGERTAVANETKWTIEKWTAGAVEVLKELKTTDYIAGAQIAFVVGNGKLSMWGRKNELEEFTERMSVSDSTYTKGYSGLRAKGLGEWCIRDLALGTMTETGIAAHEVSGRTAWSMVLTKLDGTELNEVRLAKERKLVMSLNKPSTAAFTVRPDNPLLEPLFAEDTLLKVYQGTTLRFHGNVVSTELATQEDGSQPSVKVNAADPAWRLARRVLGQSAGGTKYTGDKAKSAYKMINELNGVGSTSIKLLAESEYDSEGSGEYVAGPYKVALSCINDLAHGLDGFDWYMEPIEYTSGNIVTFQAKGVYGGSAAAAVFEHGYGQHNVRKLSYLRDLSGLANVAFHLPDEGFTEGAVVKTASDATSIATRGRYEAVADGFGLSDATLRQNWVDEFVRVRKNPRFVVSMTLDVDDLTGRVPQLGTDFWLGDLVKARSVISEMTMFNGQVRVYQIQVEINDNGTATVTPILIDEEGTEL